MEEVLEVVLEAVDFAPKYAKYAAPEARITTTITTTTISTRRPIPFFEVFILTWPVKQSLIKHFQIKNRNKLSKQEERGLPDLRRENPR